MQEDDSEVETNPSLSRHVMRHHLSAECSRLYYISITDVSDHSAITAYNIRPLHSGEWEDITCLPYQPRSCTGLHRSNVKQHQSLLIGALSQPKFLP